MSVCTAVGEICGIGPHNGGFEANHGRCQGFESAEDMSDIPKPPVPPSHSLQCLFFVAQVFLDSTHRTCSLLRDKGVDLDDLVLSDWLRRRRTHRTPSKSNMMRSPEGRGNAASSLLRRLPQSPSASAAAAVIVAAAFLPVALAHDHGTENIEEGATVSADPIVRIPDPWRIGIQITSLLLGGRACAGG